MYMYDPKGSKTAQRCKDSIVVFALPGPSTAPTSSPVHHQAPFVHSKSTPRFQKPQLSSTVQSSMTGVTVGVRGTSVCMFLTCTCKKKLQLYCTGLVTGVSRIFTMSQIPGLFGRQYCLPGRLRRLMGGKCLGWICKLKYSVT